MSEKKTPMDSEFPAFWKVPVIPDAAPRALAGTAFMMEVRLGAANMPEPIPLRNVRMAKAQ